MLKGLELAARGQAVTFTDILRAEYIAIQWVSGSGAPSVQCVTLGSLIFWENVALHRGNILTDRINELIKRMT